MSNKISLFLFLFAELSSQYNSDKLIRIRKILPNIGLYYVTGPTGESREYINRNTGPIEVLESKENGRIYAIIDNFNVVREIRYENLLVCINLLDHNRTEQLRLSDIRRHGVQFNEKLPPRIPAYIYH